MPPSTVTFTLAVIFANHVAHSIQSNDSKLSASDILANQTTHNLTSVRSNLDRVSRDTSLLSESEQQLNSEHKSLPSSVDFQNKYVFDYFNRAPQSNSQSSKSDVDKRNWSSLHSWGKRGDNSVSGFIRGDNSSPDNSLSDDLLLPLKKWSNIAAWGKRNPYNSNSLDKKWSQISSWGKRSVDLAGLRKWRQTVNDNTAFGTGKHENPDTGNGKRWSQIGAWGKRGDELSAGGLNKRWNNQMSLWGKREGSEKKWSQVSSWGKRSDESMAGEEKNSPVKKWKQMGFWGKRDAADDGTHGTMGDGKRWSQVSAWGKRDFSGNPDKKWSQVSAWGKRDLVENSLDKKWSQVSSWGKRDSSDYPDKKWSQVSAWGKRDLNATPDKKWSQVSAWGKRDLNATPDKKWSQVASWGKRSIGLNSQVQAYLNSIMHNKQSSSSSASGPIDKKWKTANFWGKRDSQAMHNFDKNNHNDLNKRWSQVSSWGKRAGASDTRAGASDTRAGASDTRAGATGGLRPLQKRMMARPAARWGMWGKRPSWSQTGFTSWGKRSEEATHHTPSLPRL